METTPPQELYVDKHVAYIKSLDTRKDELEYWLTEHLRISMHDPPITSLNRSLASVIDGVYWGLTALDLLGHRDVLPRDKTIVFVRSCQHENGGFGAHPGHDAHILTTVSAVQILAIENALDQVDKDQVARYIASLQDRETGIFAGDKWGEVDTRFTYGAFNCLSLLGKLDYIDVEKAVQYVLLCKNYDGGFGMLPGAESHAGQIFTCVGTLAIAKKLDLIDHDLLGEWLSERQLPNGGLNGRPEKLEDVCYSWWVLSSLAMIDRLHWIDRDKLVAFILSCQDPERGGIADRPNDMPDVFHTVFGIAGLSLLGYPGLREVDPKYCMPTDVIKKVVG